MDEAGWCPVCDSGDLDAEWAERHGIEPIAKPTATVKKCESPSYAPDRRTYAVTVDGERIATVWQTEEREPLMTTDGGRTYAYAHRVRKVWAYKFEAPEGMFGRKGSGYSSRARAVEALMGVAF